MLDLHAKLLSKAHTITALGTWQDKSVSVTLISRASQGFHHQGLMSWMGSRNVAISS